MNKALPKFVGIKNRLVRRLADMIGFEFITEGIVSYG